MVGTMKKTSALVSVAMLSALLETKKGDFLDIISPFIQNHLPTKLGELVDEAAILKLLQEEDGFENFPRQVLLKILNRFSKQNKGFVERKNGKYYLSKVQDNTAFDDNKRKIKEAHNAVMVALQRYLVENSKFKNITLEVTRNKFLAFLEKNGLSFIDGVDGLRAVKSSDYDNYYIARFILEEHEKKSTTYSQLREVVQGFFVYKAIYLFGKSDTPEQSLQLKNSSVFLDTALLIEALGYDTKEGENAAIELIHLIKNCGGSVKTFSHLVLEIKGILTAFAYSRNNRYSFRLHYLLDKKYTTTDILRVRDKLEENLRTLGIDIVDPVDAKELDSAAFCDLKIGQIRLSLRDTYLGEGADKRIENDILSVASVYKIKGHAPVFSLSSCKAMVVTSNFTLARTANHFCPSMKECGVGYVITDIDLMAALWLRTWDNKSHLPDMVLLENAYAACRPTPEIEKAFLECTKRLQEEGLLSEEDALVLRTERIIMEDVVEQTKNDASLVDEELIKQVLERYIEGIRSESSAENTKLKKQAEDAKKQRYEILKHIENKAKTRAQKLSVFVKVVAYVIATALVAIGCFAIVINNFVLNTPVTISIILAIVGVLGWADSIFGKKSLLNKVITKIKNKRFSRLHDKYLTRAKEEFGIDLDLDESDTLTD
jgi:hypothetical protein